MSSFVKKVLVDQAELDRMQQRQIKDYSPELHSLARLQTLIAETLARKDIPDEKKLELLYSYQSRFDKLQRDTGALFSSSLMSASAPSTAVSQKPSKTDTHAQAGVTVADHDSDQEEEEEDEVGHDAQGRTITPSLKMVRQMNIEPMYERKARGLLVKILDNTDVLKRNAQGELVVNGVAEPNSNFNSLFSSMVGRVRNLEQPGIDKFLGALRQIGVKSNELSGQPLQRMYSHTSVPVRASVRVPRPKRHQPDYVYEDLHDSDVEPEFVPGGSNISTTTKSKLKGKKSQQQSGFGLKPPGQRPNILYVY